MTTIDQPNVVIDPTNPSQPIGGPIFLAKKNTAPKPTPNTAGKNSKPNAGKTTSTTVKTINRKLEISAKDKLENWRINTVYRQDAKDAFRIDYKDGAGNNKVFLFDLLPAIENRSGNKLGGADVPEVKPGLLRRLDAKHKNIIVPGSTPVVQSIGINNSIVNLVGCFTGADEVFDTVDSARSANKLDNKVVNNVLLGLPGNKTDPNSSSMRASQKFYEDVVIPMTQVTVTIQSNNGPAEQVERLVYKGVIASFKDYFVRQNKTFYTIDLLITEYPRPALDAAKKAAKEAVLPIPEGQYRSDGAFSASGSAESVTKADSQQPNLAPAENTSLILGNPSEKDKNIKILIATFNSSVKGLESNADLSKSTKFGDKYTISFKPFNELAREFYNTYNIQINNYDIYAYDKEGTTVEQYRQLLKKLNPSNLVVAR